MRIKKHYLFLIIIFAYFLIALSKINWLGLQFDEVIFSNIAWGGIDNSIIFKKLFSIPVMIMPYMGALKSYVYYLIFHIFGASVISVRLPMIILTTFSLFFIYRSVDYFFDKKTAWLTTLLLVLNPSFISFTLFDVGPSAFELFFKTLLFLLIALYIRDKRGRWLLMILGCLILGLYNKLNFIWIVNSALLALMMSDFNFIKKISKYRGLFLIPFIIFIYIFIKYNFWSAVGLNGFFPRLQVILGGLAELVKGNLFLNYLGVWPGFWIKDLVLILWCLVVISTLIIKISQKHKDKNYFYVLSFIALMIFQMAVTTRAGNPWHMFMVEPFLTLLFVISCNFWFKRNYFIKVILGIVVLYGLWNNYQWFFGNKQEFTNIMWLKSIYALSDYTKNSKYHFVSLDWGFHNQLIMFDPIVGKYEEIWGPLITNYVSEEQKLTLINNKEIRFIAYTSIDKNSGIMSARGLWFDYVKNMGRKVVIENEFFDGNKSVISVYRVE